jgi:hypothetical protein
MVARCLKSVLLAGLLTLAVTVPARATVVFATTDAFVGSDPQKATYNFMISSVGPYLATLSDSLPAITGLELLVTVTGQATSLADVIGAGSQLFNATSTGSYTAVVLGRPNQRPSGLFAGVYGVEIATPVPTAVPEPGVWLMMLSGIGLLGWMRMRKSQSFS